MNAALQAQSERPADQGGGRGGQSQQHKHELRTGGERGDHPSPLAWPDRSSEVFGYAREEAAARTELRRAHADAGAVADLIDLVEGVNEVGADFEPSQGPGLEPVREREVHLDVSWHVITVGDAIRTGGAQAAAVDEIAADPRPTPQIGEPGRGGIGLVVVEMDEMVGDIGQLVGPGN